MKKIICDRCGAEFEYLNDLEVTGKERELEGFISEQGDYCRKCAIDMISEIQAILGAKGDAFDVEITLPPATTVPEGTQLVFKCNKGTTVAITTPVEDKQ